MSFGPRRAAASLTAFTAALLASPLAASLSAQDEPPRGEARVAPLPERTAVAGKRFVRLPAERTGVDFRHIWTSDERHAHVLGHSMAGGGLAVGDTDDDGLPELFLTRSEGGNRLYANRGNLRFSDITERAGLLESEQAWGTGAVFADVDGDADLDLTVCGYDAPNRLQLNAGDGTFTEDASARGLAFHGSSIQMSYADIDLDGDLDAYLLTNQLTDGERPDEPIPYVDGRMVVPEHLVEQYAVLVRPDGTSMMVTAAQRDHFYLNDGTGRFTEATDAAGFSGYHFGLSATWWDPDVNGLPDLYVANDFFGPDQLWANRGDGTFIDIAASALPKTPWFSMGSDAADVDGDGLPDLLASDMAATTRERHHTARGDMANSAWFLESGAARQGMRNTLFLGTGTPRFVEVARQVGVHASDWTWSTVFGDLDEDGQLDLFVSNGMSGDYFHSDLRGGVAGSSDMGRREFWADAEPLREANLAFRGTSGGSWGEVAFESVGPDWGLDHVAASYGAALVDLDDDGDLDVVTNDFKDTAGVFENRSATGHRLVVELRGRVSNSRGLGARLEVVTNDGRTRHQWLSSTRGYTAGHEPVFHVGLGDATGIERLAVHWPSGHVQGLRDLPVDQHVTMTEPGAAGPGPRSRPVPEPWFAAGGGSPVTQTPTASELTKQPLIPLRHDRASPGLALGDADGDGDDDVLLGGPGGMAPQLLRNQGGPAEPWPQSALALEDFYEDTGALWFDADSDGDLDLWVASGGVEVRAGSSALQDRLYLNDGSGELSAAKRGTLPRARHASSALAAADIDGDGDLDVLSAGRVVPAAWPTTPSTVLYRNNGGTFVDATDELAPGLADVGMVSAAVFLDMDRDGDADLLTACAWGPLDAWRNEDGTLIRLRGAFAPHGHGLWSSLAVGDINGDGSLDVFAGNIGNNSHYRPEPGRPVVALHGDLDGGGVARIVEVQDDGAGRLMPLRVRDDVLPVMPFLAEDVPDYASWSRASAQDLFGTEAVAAATRVRLDEVASLVLLNDGTGTFRSGPVLPAMAQASPANGAALADLNGDGHLDLALAQNSYAIHREHGALNGGVGVVMRGRGDGSFVALRPDASGVIVPEEGLALAVTDLDGDSRPDLLMTVSEGPLRTFWRTPAHIGRWLGVRLVGPAGNLRGVGARVTVHFADGTRSIAESHAGGGDMAQDGATLFFGCGERTPTQIEVRWPDGSVRDHAVPAAAAEASITVACSRD